MSNNNNDDEEILILVDEDGNEIQIDETVESVGTYTEVEPEAEEPIRLYEGVAERKYEEPVNGDTTVFTEETVNDIIDGSFGEVTLEEEYQLDGGPIVSGYEDFDSRSDSDEEEGFLAGTASKLMLMLGAVIILIGICVIGITALKKKAPQTPEFDFSSLGKNIASIEMIGGDNIQAILNSESERLDALYEAQKTYDYQEADQENGISSVSITLTSILKDLKIKIVNSKGKLIGNVPFQVEVTGPDGKTVIWEDEDKDGIIYKTELTGGDYKVKIVPLLGYDSMYDFSTCKGQSLSVKSQLDYQKVDVDNEIKNSSQVDKTEDAAEKEIEVESKLKDTVTYVMSSRTASSNGYGAVDKKNIDDPMTTLRKKYEASLARFQRLSGQIYMTLDEGDASGNDTPGEGGGEGGGETPNPPAEHEHKYSTDWECENGKHFHKCVSNDGLQCKKPHEDEADCDYSNKTKVTIVGDKNTKKHTVSCSVCGLSSKEFDCVDADSDHKCDFCGGTISEAVVVAIKEFTGTKQYSLTDDTKKSGTVTVVWDISPAPDENKITYSWTSDSDCVSLSDVDKKTVSVTANKAGKAVLTCKVTYEGVTASNPTCEITVGPSVTVAFDKTEKKKVLFTEDSDNVYTIQSTCKGGTNCDVEWKVTSGDASVVELKAEAVSGPTADSNGINSKVTKCTVKGLKEGTVTVSAVSKEDTSVAASITIVVCKNPKNDTSTKLTDNSGRQLYKYDDASKKYVEATYSDYYTGKNLYLPEEITYIYQGWWTIDGKTYYFDTNGKAVTGEQVILGMKYSFDANGVLKSGTGSFGIDVSTWNGTIDWSKVAKSGVTFAIIRCGFRGTTVGGLVQDNKFETNIKNATDAGIKVGVYFFTQAITEAEAVEEASMCLSLVEGKKIKYPIFIDVESATNGRANGLSKDQRTAIVKAFCKTIANGGYNAGIYANKNWLNNYLNTSELTGYTIWLAQYSAQATYNTTRYDLWQYSNQGSISGISGNVDLDTSYLGY